MRRHLLEETYETIEAIEADSAADVREELGDLYMLVTMIARMYEESERFTVTDVLEEISEKLVRRHPHVFGESTITDSSEVVEQWQQIKEQEGKRSRTSLLDEVSRALPSLERAHKLQRKAAKVGFDWPTLGGVRAKLLEEIDEVMDEAGGPEALDSARREHDTASPALEQEIGDLLFSAVNLARYLGVDPSTALNRANNKFTSRFHHVESEMGKRGRELHGRDMELMDELWNSAKG
jgi:tetrapyrrole methylase family protein/MazG family protein